MTLVITETESPEAQYLLLLFYLYHTMQIYDDRSFSCPRQRIPSAYFAMQLPSDGGNQPQLPQPTPSQLRLQPPADRVLRSISICILDQRWISQ